MIFDDFYQLYPRHISRRDAEKAWLQIGEENQVKAMEALPHHIKLWQVLGMEKQFLPYPGSWLRGYRWEDEIELPKPKVTINWQTDDNVLMAKAKELGVHTQGRSRHEIVAAIQSKQH